MNAFVLDASVACAWLFEDESTPSLQKLLDLTVTCDVYVPALWHIEVANTLIQALRRQRITEQGVIKGWDYLQQMRIHTVSTQSPIETLLEVSQEHGLTAYDAEYLALAQRLGLPLATLDSTLRRAAQRAGLTVLGKS